jgi:hypothetical protein
MRPGFAGLCSGVIAAASCPASASLVYDGFNYPPGTYDISNPPPSGGVGFSAEPWSLRIQMAQPGLTHPVAIHPIGGKAGSSGSARGLSLGANRFLPTDTYWASFLANNEGLNGDVLLQFYGGSTLNISTDVRSSPGSPVGEGHLTMLHAVFGQPQLIVRSPSGTVPISGTKFVLMRFSPRTGGQRVDAWVNPTSIDSLGAPLLGIDTAVLNTAGLSIMNSNIGSRWIDEIRMDRSVGAVMAPGPSGGIMLLGMTVAASCRRRRQLTARASAESAP